MHDRQCGVHITCAVRHSAPRSAVQCRDSLVHVWIVGAPRPNNIVLTSGGCMHTSIMLYNPQQAFLT